MKHIGIIAEYNPLHLGHARQLDYVRRVLHADCISVVMSGDFVQRGAPAWTDKYLRTRMALSAGADLVLALPVRYSLSSAEGFARGGVSTLAALDVDGICFGTEADSLEQLRDIAARLHTLRCSAEYDNQLRAHLRRGLTYPQALTQMLSDHGICCAGDLLSSPNNILALCYLEQLQELAPQITPYSLPRNDSGYHNTDASGSIISRSFVTNSPPIPGRCCGTPTTSVSDLTISLRCSTIASGTVRIPQNCRPVGFPKICQGASSENFRSLTGSAHFWIISRHAIRPTPGSAGDCSVFF